MADVARELIEQAEQACAASSGLLKLHADLAQTWALSPEGETIEELVNRLLGVYVRAAYGLGYVDALTD